jgi:hypothetical protein
MKAIAHQPAATTGPRDSDRSGGSVLARISGIVGRIRARIVRALVLYLAKPVSSFATLTSADLNALAAVLHRGDVLLSAGNTRCAVLVNRVTRSTWSHVSMYVGPLDDGDDPLCVVEADIAGGVQAIRLSQLNARCVCVLRAVQLNDTDRNQLADSVVSQIGSEYDLGYAWTLARKFLMRRWRARLGSVPATMGKGATRFICSSLIAQAFALIGHSILPTPPVGQRVEAESHGHLTPADFERASSLAIVWRAGARERLG